MAHNIDHIEDENNLVKTRLGASGASLEDLSGPNLGALNRYLNLGKQLMGERKETNPWLHAFQYFSNMAAEASKPGATALGAAGQAGTLLSKSLIEEHKAKRAEELAGAGLGIKLATALGKPKTFKQYPTGDTATYMTKANAEQYLVNKGMPRNAPTFASIVAKLTAPTDSMVGKPIVIADSFQAIAPVVRGNTIVDVNFTAIAGQKPPNVEYRQKRLPILAKNNDYVAKSFETLSTVEQAMDLLLTGDVQTGGLAELTLPIKNLFGQLFGVDDPEVQNLQMIQSISNVLAPKMRPVGSGSTSDMEFKAYQRSIADIGNTPRANYISLYTFKRRMENSREANQKELEILTSGGTVKDVKEAIDKIDPGIYEKYTGDMDDVEEFNDWVASLPDGAVIYNRSSDGKGKLFDDDPNIFIIKGWGGS